MRKAKLGLILGLSLALVLVLVQNTSTVQGRFLWFSADVPVILLLVLTAAGGFILGLLVAIFYQRDKKPVPVEQIALINQLSPENRITAGSRVKMVR